MQNPNEDTEWNDVLRQKGILPTQQQRDLTENDVINIIEDTVKTKFSDRNVAKDSTLDDLDVLDEEDERMLLAYKKQRIAEMKALAKKRKFGDVREISAVDYVEQVNQAGDEVWVVLHLYKSGIPLCEMVNAFLSQLAQKYPSTKFLKSISDLCIPNFPERNLPAIFVYYEGQMKKQFIGAKEFSGQTLNLEELEIILSNTGALNNEDHRYGKQE